MDAIRKFLAKMKKVHFWLLSVFLLGLGIGTWFSAAGNLKAEFKANRTTIDGMFKSLEPVKQVSPHPNAKFEVGMQELIAARQKGVLQAWKTKWDHQSQLLKWPEKMTAEFLKHVHKYPVMEQIDIQKDPKQDIPRFLREAYQGFIQEELPRLAQIADAKWRAIIDETDDSALPVSGEEVDVSVVDWNHEDQVRLVGDFTWKDKQGVPIVPQTLDIYVAQENLWVLSSLMHIVKETNGGADQRHLAAIKKIDFMRVGLSAVKLDNAGKVEVIRPNEVSADAEADSLGAELSPYGAPGMGGLGDGDFPGVPGTGTVLNAVDPLGNRYIDEKFASIEDGMEVREAVNNPTIEKTALGVAKRLPVRLRFKMDTRKIPELLVACANAPLMLEVKQLRVARPPAPAAAADKSGTMSSMAAASSDMMPGSRDMDDMDGPLGIGFGGGGRRRGFGDGPPRGGGYPGAGNQEDEAAELLLDRSQRSFPFDDYVEVFGLVYIYNRPNEKVIQGADDQPGANPSGLVSN